MNAKSDRQSAQEDNGSGLLLAGRYQMVRRIGHGGMGSVYLAMDTRLGNRLLAVKLTRPLPEERDDYIAEARLLSRLSHPRLPQIVDYAPPDENGLALIVMTYIEGETLADRFRALGRIPFAQALRYLLQLAEVLAYLHAQNPMVVFRDLKPANVMLDSRDEVVLVDFGIARQYRPGAASDTVRLGTPAFAAPEQLRGEQTDARTDLYALGALAYHLITGGAYASGFPGGPVPSVGPDVPPLFRDSVERLLSEQPEKRPASAEEVIQLWEAMRYRDDAYESSSSTFHSINDRSKPDRLGVKVIAIASAYPGAGATFAACLLSERLAQIGKPHALVECPGGHPELYHLLDGLRRMPAHAVFADPSGSGAVAPVWRSGLSSLYPLDPATDDAAGNPPSASLGSWLRRLGVPLVLIDVSGKWQDAKTAAWLTEHADSLWLVADAMPAKWTERRQHSCMDLLAAARGRGRSVAWIANRDHKFPERREWLALYPEPPLLHLPLLKGEEMIAALWRGGVIPLQSRDASLLDKALKNLLG